MRKYINIFLLIFLTITWTTIIKANESYLHHEIEVTLDPNNHNIKVKNQITIPEPLLNTDIHFLLHKDLSIELFPAYTIKKNTHPKSNEWAGIIIESGGKSVYHAGDTGRIPEMKNLAKRNITVALLPCGGIYTMDFEEAIEVALDIKPEIVVPMHHWGKDLNEFKELLEKKDPTIKVEILENKTLEI